MKPRTISKNAALFLAGCLIGIAVLEVLLRIYNPLEIRFKPDRIILPANKRYVIDNRGKFNKLDRTTVHTKNSLGFRGDPPPRDFANYLTLITIGGSTTECFYLSDGHTWPDLLGQKLSKDFHHIWINNAGLDGATTYRHIILLEDYVVKLKPKAVLFLVGINDVGAGNLDEPNRERPSLKDFIRFISYHSEVYSLGQNLYRYFIAQSRGLRHWEIDLTKAGRLETIPPETEQKTLMDYKKNSLPFYEQRLEKLIKICRVNGIEVVFITQPTLYGTGKDEITGVDLATVRLQDRLNGNLMFQVVELYNDATRRTARREGIFLIDLARQIPRNSAYYYDYLHFTNAGAERVAGIICKTLSPFLAAKYPSFRR